MGGGHREGPQHKSRHTPGASSSGAWTAPHTGRLGCLCPGSPPPRGRPQDMQAKAPRLNSASAQPRSSASPPCPPGWSLEPAALQTPAFPACPSPPSPAASTCPSGHPLAGRPCPGGIRWEASLGPAEMKDCSNLITRPPAAASPAAASPGSPAASGQSPKPCLAFPGHRHLPSAPHTQATCFRGAERSHSLPGAACPVRCDAPVTARLPSELPPAHSPLLPPRLLEPCHGAF